MEKWFSKMPDDTTQQTRSRVAFRVAAVLLLVLVVFDVFSTYNFIRGETVQLLFAMLLSYAATISTLFCVWLIRQNRISTAVWGLILTNLTALLLSPLLGSGLGIIYAVTAIVITAVTAGQGLEEDQITRANVAGVIFGLATYLLDISLPVNTATNLNGGVTYAILFGLQFVLVFIAIRQFRGYTLRAKLVILFLAVSIIPLSILTFYNYWKSYDTFTNNANDVLSGAASLTAYQLDTYFEQNLNVIRSESQLPDVIDYLGLPADARAGSQEDVRVQKFINALVRQDPIYGLSVSVMDVSGNVLVDTNSTNINSNRSNADYFQRALEVGLPYASAVEFGQQTSIYFISPVRNTKGKIIGLLSKQYNASILQVAIIRNNGLAGPASFPVLLDNNHMRLADGDDQSVIYKTIVPLNANVVSALQSKRLLPAGAPDDISTNLYDFEENLNKMDRQPYFKSELHSGDQDVEQVAVAKMTTQPWVVVFAQPREVFLAPIDLQVRNNVFVTILLSLVVAGVGFVVSQTIARPIARLTKTAEAIHQGNLNLSAQVESQDEIGKLALAFNEMTFQLRSFINSLEQRVAERTAAAENARAEAEDARKNIETQIWLATGQTQLADAMRGEQDIAQLAENVISQICQYTGAQAGALFVLNEKTLTLVGRYAYMDRSGFDGSFQLGEGLVGQAAADGKVMTLDAIPSDALVISTGLADMQPRQLAAAPFYMNGKVVGVIELATLSRFRQIHLDLWDRISESIGSAFNTVQTRQRLAELLIESQQQAEELQTQDEELRAANEELQAQAENLKAARAIKVQKDEA